MCEGMRPISDAHLPDINPKPEIGDIWSLRYENAPVQYYLILDVFEGGSGDNAFRTLTTLNLLDGMIIDEYLDATGLMKYDSWTKEG